MASRSAAPGSHSMHSVLPFSLTCTTPGRRCARPSMSSASSGTWKRPTRTSSSSDFGGWLALVSGTSIVLDSDFRIGAQGAQNIVLRQSRGVVLHADVELGDVDTRHARQATQLELHGLLRFIEAGRV